MPSYAIKSGRSPRAPGTYNHPPILPPEMRTQKPPNRQFDSQHQSLGSYGRPNVSLNGTHRTKPSTAHLTGPIMKEDEIWQTWPELTFRLGNVPSDVTTFQLWKRFQREGGTVVYIEIYEDRRGGRDSRARIKFSPVPSSAFWRSRFLMPTGDGEGAFELKVEPEGRKRNNFEIQSPVQNSVWYPEIMILRPSAITFGMMCDEDTMMAMYNLSSLSRNEMSFGIELKRNRINVKFHLDLTNPAAKQDVPVTGGVTPGIRNVQIYMFQIPFGQLEKIYRVQLNEDRWAFIITLDSPPQFYRRRPVQASHSEDTLVWSDFDAYLRQTDIVYDREPLKTSPISLNKDRVKSVIDIGTFIGRWTTYQFIFDNTRNERHLCEKVVNALQDFNIEVVDLGRFSVIPPNPVSVWSILETPTASVRETDLSLLEKLSEDYSLPFEVRYQLEACISDNCINEHKISPEFLQDLSTLATHDPSKAKHVLEYVHGQKKRIFNPMTIFEDKDAMNHCPDAKIPDYCAMARKATITPTTVYFSSPTVETTNRVIREFSTLGDRFLRVQFTDEKFEGRINSCADKVRNDEIFTRIYRTLTNGIRIGDRHYEFLAFGNSQFRENGAYFFCPTEEVTCAGIRNWMGDFRHITIVAKCAARLGQCFSTTRAIGGRVQITAIEDVERNGFCFTDGVGKISQVLATRIADELGLPSALAPSVFQFRMGGCKGILAVSPEVKGLQALIRRSQEKFRATYNGLEIIRCSRFSVATLNRQTITILSSLGVSDEVFNHMLSDQLSDYILAMTDRRLALDRLALYVDDNYVTMTIAKMILDGFMESQEPFLLSILNLWRAWSIKLLKEKARIVVEKGAFLLGCTDETQTLRGHVERQQKFGDEVIDEDLPQIFVQIPDKTKTDQYTVVKGRCCVGRNPSLHPGDIRVVMAVDVPALHHLHDVVVFPQLGDRDIPNMCSGGDLDGDDFFVIWDPNLIPKEVNCVPMDYKAPKPVELNRPVEIADMTKFFVRYMKNDALPKIALAHLGNSDWMDRSVKDPKCVRLAHLHSQAVDYVKTGEPAIMVKSDSPREWPHFMERKHQRQYHSDGILGQLYDKVQSVDFAPNYESPFDDRILKAYPTDNAILKIARRVKSKYDTAMRRIMAQQEIKMEFEVWTTFVLTKPRVGSDYKMQETMGVIGGALKDRFRRVCIEEAGGKDFDKLGPFVAAMYRVTYEEMQIALQECRTMIMVGGRNVPKRKMEPKYMPLISFPWLFHDALGRIATGIETREDLENLGLPFLTTKAQATSRKISESSLLDDEDVVEVLGGVVTHRGEVLDLFGRLDVDSEGDDIEQPHHEMPTKNGYVKTSDFDPNYDVSPQGSPLQQPVVPRASTSPISLLTPQPASRNLSQIHSLSNMEGYCAHVSNKSQSSSYEIPVGDHCLTTIHADDPPLCDLEIENHRLLKLNLKPLQIPSSAIQNAKSVSPSSLVDLKQLQLPSVPLSDPSKTSPVSTSILADLSEPNSGSWGTSTWSANNMKPVNSDDVGERKEKKSSSGTAFSRDSEEDMRRRMVPPTQKQRNDMLSIAKQFGLEAGSGPVSAIQVGRRTSLTDAEDDEEECIEVEGREESVTSSFSNLGSAAREERDVEEEVEEEEVELELGAGETDMERLEMMLG